MQEVFRGPLYSSGIVNSSSERTLRISFSGSGLMSAYDWKSSRKVFLDSVSPCGNVIAVSARKRMSQNRQVQNKNCPEQLHGFMFSPESVPPSRHS